MPIDVKSLISKLGLSIDVVKRFYCNKEEVSEDVLKKLVLLELELVNNGVIELSTFIHEVFCKEKEEKKKEEKIDITKVIKEEVREERKEDVEEGKEENKEVLEDVVDKVEIPIVQAVGDSVQKTKLVIAIKNGKLITNIGICNEIEDVVLGSVNIYINCGDKWYTFTHTLSKDEYLKIQDALSKLLEKVYAI